MLVVSARGALHGRPTHGIQDENRHASDTFVFFSIWTIMWEERDSSTLPPLRLLDDTVVQLVVRSTETMGGGGGSDSLLGVTVPLHHRGR